MIRTNNDITSLRKEIGARLAQFRDMLGLLQSEFAKELDLSPRSYQNYELGIREVPISVVSRLVAKFGLNSHWLITGHGGPYYLDPVTASRTALEEIINLASGSKINPDLSKLPDIVAITVEQETKLRSLSEDEMKRLIRLASRPS